MNHNSYCLVSVIPESVSPEGSEATTFMAQNCFSLSEVHVLLLAKIISIANMSVCATSVPIWWIIVRCWLAMPASDTPEKLHVLYRKMSPPLFLQSTRMKTRRFSHRLSFLQNQKEKQFISILPFPTNSARLLWCWCERAVNIFSFTPSGATRPCAALIILHSFLSLCPPSV